MTQSTKQAAPIETQAVIIGAGPVALFQAFQLGLQEVQTHLVEALPHPGGQCAELYPTKPIYDIPGLPVVSGQELTERLLTQLKPFSPPMHLGQQVQSLARQPDGRWLLTSQTGQQWLAPAVVVAAGVGAFVPRKPAIEGLEAFEGTQVLYHGLPAEMGVYDQIVIMGGDDAAVSTALQVVAHRLSQAKADQVPSAVQLLHRTAKLTIESPELQAAWQQALDQGQAELVVGQPVGWHAHPKNKSQMYGLDVVTADDATIKLGCDVLLPRLGLSPKLGPIAQWGLAMERKLLPVDTATFQTSEPGIYAVGDINTYPGKRKLIVSGFHEATLAAFAIAAQLRPGERQLLQYTTTSPRLHELLGVKPSS